jgi:glutathione peroxidase
MPCCCACKSPFVLVLAAGLAAALGYSAIARSDDPKPQPATPAGPTSPAPFKPGTIDVKFDKEDIHKAVELLAMNAGKKADFSDGVQASVTATLYGVTLKQALDAVIKINGYGYYEEDGVIHVRTLAEMAARDAKPAAPASSSSDANVLGFKVKRLDGKDEDLSIYKGKVLMIVNVASKCGLTPQYAALEKLYESKKDKGFVILGFPANEFGSQEPGTNAEIAEFCSGKDSQYHVTFPMFEKVIVKGKGVAPLYQRLIAQPAPIGGEPKWNFTKFIVDKSGNVVARFEPKTKPDDEQVTKKIDELLQSEPSGASRRSESH